MKLSTIAFLVIPAAVVTAQYDIEQLGYQLGTAMTHVNTDRITLSNMIDNFSPAISGSRNMEQAKKFWDNYIAANRLAMDSILMLELFYYNYNATKSTLSYGSNCAMD